RVLRAPDERAVVLQHRVDGFVRGCDPGLAEEGHLDPDDRAGLAQPGQGRERVPHERLRDEVDVEGVAGHVVHLPTGTSRSFPEDRPPGTRFRRQGLIVRPWRGASNAFAPRVTVSLPDTMPSGVRRRCQWAWPATVKHRADGPAARHPAAAPRPRSRSGKVPTLSRWRDGARRGSALPRLPSRRAT